jgi:hypothetical protein
MPRLPGKSNWNSPDLPMMVLAAWILGFMALCSILRGTF